MVKRICARLCCLVGALAICATGAERTADTPALKYAFKPGQSYTYQVRIEAETPEYVETLSGESVYKVKAVDATSGRMTLVQSANLVTQRKTKDGHRPGPMRIGPPPFGQMGSLPNYNQSREVVIDPLGDVVRYESKGQLPYLLGAAWGLVLEPLGEKKGENWQAKRDMEVSSQQSHGLWLPRPIANKEVAQTAKETIDYVIKGNENGVVTIEKKYLLATRDLVDGEPALEQKGTGTIQFDTKLGMIRSLEEKLTIRMNEPGVTVKIPVTVSAKLATAEELAKLAAQRKEEAAKLAQKHKEMMEKHRAEMAKTNPDLLKAQDDFDKAIKAGASPEEIERLMAAVQKASEAGMAGNTPGAVDDAGIDAALAKLKQADRSKVQEGARTLAVSNVIDKRRAEVAKALEKLLSEQDHFVRTEALKALKTWGTGDNVPKLIALMDDENHFVQTGAMDALGGIKDERAAAAIANQLTDFGVRRQAKLALVAMGPVAEKHVLPLLKNKDWALRSDVCQILAEIGTDKSIEPLREAAKDRNHLVQQKAEDALRAVEGRQK
jgi:HEAT repeat protein